MKKAISALLCCFAICISAFTGCSLNNNVDNETVIIENKEYEIINSDWTPYGNTRFNGEYYLYENDSNTIFAKGKDNILFDGVIYHNTDDTYPDISMSEKIDKIILEADNNQIVPDDDITDLILEELGNISGSLNCKTAAADLSKADIYINVYYKNYPASQNEFVICFSEDSEPGVMYCETYRNTNTFGENKMMLFFDKDLIAYINSLV